MNEKVNARIQALEAELAGLKKELAEPKKEGRFRAEIGEEYFFVTSTFDCIRRKINFANEGSGHFDVFNSFKTQEECNKMAEKTKLMFEMTARVKELNGDWVADWGNQNTKKWGIKQSEYGYIIDWCTQFSWYVFGLPVQSKEHAEILLNEFKERIEKYY